MTSLLFSLPMLSQQPLKARDIFFLHIPFWFKNLFARRLFSTEVSDALRYCSQANFFKTFKSVLVSYESILSEYPYVKEAVCFVFICFCGCK